MKAKEVLHYYIGQTVLRYIPGDKIQVKRGTLTPNALRDILTNDLRFTLELRPLPDMTEEELREIEIITERKYWGIEDYVELHAWKLTPAEFHYLLSHGFDLFGLIESGEAIKKEK